MAEAGPSCRLYLTLPAQAPDNLESLFAQALAEADVACALLRRDEARSDDSPARALQKLAQERDVALVVQDDPALAHRIDADGVHIPADSSLYRAARDLLGSKAIIGADCGLVRHDAMVLAELGADYVAFGVPGADRADGKERRNASIAWWAETFEVPCVAMEVESPDEAVRLAQAGADFVALSQSLWAAEDPVKIVVAVQTALARAGSLA